MIDIETETVVTMTQAAKKVPTHPNLSTLWRWRTVGVRGIKLETLQIARRPVTSIEALQRFFDRITAAKNGLESPKSRTPKQRQRAIEAAEKELEKAGV